VVLLQHGNPAWGYYYRHAIGPLARAGFRVVVPDLVGFGRSDKPVRRSEHTYAHHEAWLLDLVRQLDLRDVNAHLHDWGGLLGLRLVAFEPERFARVLASNTSLPLGDGGPVPPLFRVWQLGAQVLPTFGRVIRQQSSRPLPAGAVAAYDAPFPDHAAGLGPRQLPLEVPLRPGDAGAARNRQALAALARFDRPFLTAFSEPDDITTGAAELLQATVPGARTQVLGREHATFPGTLHYLMEDAPEELTELMLEFFAPALEKGRSGRNRTDGGIGDGPG
jgi:haloalkane dehalogenase